jgi:hypothetical protein
MERTEDSTEPPPNVLLIVAMAAGIWVLMFLGAASVWSWQARPSDIGIETEYVPQFASIIDRSSAKLATRIGAKSNRKKHSRTSLATRLFRPTVSVN